MIRPQSPVALPLNINSTSLFHYHIFQPWYLLPNRCHLQCFVASTVHILRQPIATRVWTQPLYRHWYFWQTYVSQRLSRSQQGNPKWLLERLHPLWPWQSTYSIHVQALKDNATNTTTTTKIVCLFIRSLLHAEVQPTLDVSAETP